MKPKRKPVRAKLDGGGKVRWQFSLPLPVYNKLKRLSKKTGLSMSEIIRRAVRMEIDRWAQNRGEK